MSKNSLRGTVAPAFLDVRNGLEPTENIEDPEYSPIVGFKVSTHRFKSFFEFVEFKPEVEPWKSGYSWWHDGMGSHVSEYVIVFADDPKGDFFVGFQYKDDPGYFLFLGRVKPGSFLAEDCAYVIHEFLAATGKS